MDHRSGAVHRLRREWRSFAAAELFADVLPCLSRPSEGATRRSIIRQPAAGRHSEKWHRAPPLFLPANADQKFAEILAGEHSNERLRRVLQAIDNVFAILDPSFRDP